MGISSDFLPHALRRWHEHSIYIYLVLNTTQIPSNTQIKKYQEYTGYLMVFVLFFLSLPATPFFFGTYPLINVYITIENHHRTSEFSHETWGFSIAIWLFTRGYVSKGWQLWPTAGVLHPDLNLGDQKINHTLW